MPTFKVLRRLSGEPSPVGWAQGLLGILSYTGMENTRGDWRSSSLYPPARLRPSEAAPHTLVIYRWVKGLSPWALNRFKYMVSCPAVT